ncbi:MAG: metallophosphoesterase [Oscillospiraceae bacterium]|jgi:hypothetical protein|nr:metallophosphoesterase [Oscillospiraceae bacterium]
MSKIWLTADTHIFARTPTPDKPPRSDIRCILETEAILDCFLHAFCTDTDAEILLIAGDLTDNGHAAEHKALLPKLRSIKAAGKRVIVITATHDYGQTHITEQNDSGTPPLSRPDGKVYRHEMHELYKDFGFNEAIADYPADPNTYAVQLLPNLRLLCLNDDGDGHEYCGYSPAQLDWICTQIRNAKEENQYIFAMTHHPTLPPAWIYPKVSHRDMLGGYETTPAVLADTGLHLMFSGHAHMHNIARIKTKAGNRYADINTASLVGWPGLYRELTFSDGVMQIRSRTVPSPYDGAYLRSVYEKDLRAVLDAAAHDYERFAGMLGGFSVTPERARKLKPLLYPLGKLIGSKAGTELFLRTIRNIWCGKHDLETIIQL